MQNLSPKQLRKTPQNTHGSEETQTFMKKHKFYLRLEVAIKYHDVSELLVLD